MFVIGLMSGTSMDGVDAALIETDGTPEKLIEYGHYHLPYDSDFRNALKSSEQAIRAASGDLEQLSPSDTQKLKQLTKQSALYHVKAVKALHSLQPNLSYDLIGYHGQTLFHQPERGISHIIGDPNLLMKELNCPVVYDFRAQDIAAGGQGAPLAPIYHQALAIRDKKLPLAVANCGGIANISFIPDDKPESMIAFDTGPGNALLDSFVRTRTQNKEHMDQDGRYGLTGKINHELFAALLSNAVTKQGKNYLLAPPPKSLDYGDLLLIKELELVSIEDGCRTLAAFTAQTICDSVDFIGQSIPEHWVLAGGGWSNPVILQELKQRLRDKIGSQVTVQTASEIGWQNQAIEAQLFAYLAARSFHKLPLSYPNTTGVNQACIGGQLFQPNQAVEA